MQPSSPSLSTRSTRSMLNVTAVHRQRFVDERLGAFAFSLTGFHGMKFWIRCQSSEPALQTELELLLYLLENRVFSSDLWELFTARHIEIQEEYSLRALQQVRHGRALLHTERNLMEAKKSRAQIEVSLYSQAIAVIQQDLNLDHEAAGFECSPMQEKNPYKTNFPPTPFVRDKCNDWLLSLHSAFMDVPEEENSSGEDLELASIYQHCKSPLIACMVLKGSNASASDIGSPFAFVTTLVNRETQQTYDDARGIELACLEELTADLDTDVCCKPHSPELEFRILWTRMYRARTEVLLLSQAIERANEFESSDGGSSRGGSIRALTPPLELECDDIASESSYGMKSISFSDVAFP